MWLEFLQFLYVQVYKGKQYNTDNTLGSLFYNHMSKYMRLYWRILIFGLVFQWNVFIN